MITDVNYFEIGSSINTSSRKIKYKQTRPYTHTPIEFVYMWDVDAAAYQEKAVPMRVRSKQGIHTANLKIIDARYHDFNGFPVVNWY